MKSILFFIGFLCTLQASAQVSLLPQHSFFKDQIFANKLSQPLTGAFFPVTENEYNLIPAIIDSSKQYYDFTQTLFKKHLFEITGDDYFLTISPTFDFSLGADILDTSDRRLTQNTRGFLIEGDLLDKVSFSTSFYENQAVFARYESAYYKELGELYLANGQYATQNAVVPGAGRTKNFKTDGFDYAYAIGNVIYKPWNRLTIAVGNNSHFIGSGYRSLLLSDNSYSAPYLRADWKIHPKFQIRVLRAKLLNLLRRPLTSSAESYYEAKGYSVNYFTWLPTEKLQLSLFEGVVWNRGDSVTYRAANPLFYNPVPGVASLLDPNETNSLIGLNFSYQLLQKHLVYGQVALPNWAFDKTGFQLGYRGYNFFGLNDFMVQLEYNYLPDGMYASQNPRLNYTHYNLPLGHIRGDGVQELIIRTNYEWQRIYVDLLFSYSLLDSYNPRDLLPTNALSNPGLTQNFNVSNLQVEMGYRFNRKLNFSVFGKSVLRSTSEANGYSGTIFQLGIRTGLINHYNDF